MPRTFNREVIEAGKRMADQINARLTFSDPWEIRKCWMAFRLQDGTTDGTLYDTILDAKKHTDEHHYCYFAFLNYLGGITAYECSVYLDFHRSARNAGLGQANPQDHPFMSVKQHDRFSGRMN